MNRFIKGQEALRSKTAIREGDVARVLVDTEALHFFDPVTGESIRSQRAG
jgi:hypothetical protein